MSKIPDYPKEIRDNFTFHYWTVEILKLGKASPSKYDEGFTVIDGEVYWIRFFPRNKFINRWEFNEERIYKIMKELIPIENDLTGIIKKKIMSYRNSWSKENNSDNIIRDVTVAVLKGSDKWGLAIYKPDDHFPYIEVSKEKETVHTINFMDAFEIERIKTIKKRKKINFTKKLGQAWAIKDFHKKYYGKDPWEIRHKFALRTID